MYRVREGPWRASHSVQAARALHPAWRRGRGRRRGHPRGGAAAQRRTDCHDHEPTPPGASRRQPARELAPLASLPPSLAPPTPVSCLPAGTLPGLAELEAEPGAGAGAKDQAISQNCRGFRGLTRRARVLSARVLSARRALNPVCPLVCCDRRRPPRCPRSPRTFSTPAQVRPRRMRNPLLILQGMTPPPFQGILLPPF